MQPPAKPRRPEDAELSRKVAELAELQSRLADFELQLLTLRIDLGEFEKVYYSKVGALYAELDEVEALIAERLAQLRPLDTEATEAASDARKRANESRRVADSARVLPLPIERSPRLKDLYRSAARQLHPDLAQNDRDRAIRERLMTEANLAYANGDESKLEAILEEYQCRGLAQACSATEEAAPSFRAFAKGWARCRRQRRSLPPSASRIAPS